MMTDAERIEALQDLGYDEREAGFLAVAALHSGYFLRRQFESFVQLKRGRVSSEFLRKTVEAGHARVNVYAHRTGVYHLFARPFYRAIAEEENRNRRSRPPLSIKAKLMALDYVLGHRSHHYLATEQEKVDYFVLTLGIDPSKLPAKSYRSAAHELGTRRYFVEKYPLFLSTSSLSSSPVVSLCYVDEGVLSTTGFESFLNRYRRLFTALRRFRLVYVAAEQLHLRSAERKFLRFSEELSFPEQCRPGGILGDYFWLRYLLDTSQWALLDTAGLNRLGNLTRRFRSSPIDQRFEDWKEELAAAQGSGPVDAGFETVRLPYHYDIFGTTGTATKPSNQEHRIAGGAPPKASAINFTAEAKPLRFQPLNARRQAGRAVKGMQAGRERPRFLGGCSAQKPLSAAIAAPRVAPAQPASEVSLCLVRSTRLLASPTTTQVSDRRTRRTHSAHCATYTWYAPACARRIHSAGALHNTRAPLSKLQEGDSNMSVIERQPKLTRKESLSVRLAPQVMRLLECYCEFIDSRAHHVIEEALKFTFGKDRDFQSWLEKNGATRERGDSQGTS